MNLVWCYADYRTVAEVERLDLEDVATTDDEVIVKFIPPGKGSESGAGNVGERVEVKTVNGYVKGV
jgi:hypothetical protein